MQQFALCRVPHPCGLCKGGDFLGLNPNSSHHYTSFQESKPSPFEDHKGRGSRRCSARLSSGHPFTLPRGHPRSRDGSRFSAWASVSPNDPVEVSKGGAGGYGSSSAKCPLERRALQRLAGPAVFYCVTIGDTVMPHPCGLCKGGDFLGLDSNKDLWRIRVGDMRVVCIIDDAAKAVSVTRIAHR